MYELKITHSFSAAHQLRNYKGKCENLHGHNWKVEVYFISEILNNVGLVVDFTELKSLLKEILNELDHKNLNDLPEFSTINPSSENIAKWIYNSLKSKIIKLHYNDLSLFKVTVWESENACASFYE